MPFDRVVDMTSVSIKPHIVVHLFRVWTADFLVIIIWYKPLKHVVNVLVCDDWQCGVPSRTKLSRFIPTQHWTISVETIVPTVHWVALDECWYGICDAQQNHEAYVSYNASALPFTAIASIFLFTVVIDIVIVVFVFRTSVQCVQQKRLKVGLLFYLTLIYSDKSL